MLKRSVTIGLVVINGMAVALLQAGSASAGQCQRRYQDLALPVYDRLVRVFAYRHLTCAQAAQVGNAVAESYERGLPLADYPRATGGVPGGLDHTFRVRTRHGTFACRMTARGSDFVQARCRRGEKFVRFESDHHWFLHGQ